MANVKDYSVEEKLSSLVTLQKIESKIDEVQILKGELPMEVSDLEDEITGLTVQADTHRRRDQWYPGIHQSEKRVDQGSRSPDQKIRETE